MAKHETLGSLFTDIADKLREKGCEEDQYDTICTDFAEGALPQLPDGATSWRMACYGGGRFLAVPMQDSVSTKFSVMAYSDDGLNWSEVTTPARSWSDGEFCYGNGKFIFCSVEGPLYSETGVDWMEMEMPSTGGWRAVCYGNGKFVALGVTAQGMIARAATAAVSTDGINWTSNENIHTANWRAVCYGNGKFVAIYSGGIAVSEDGLNWSDVKVLDVPQMYWSWYEVCYGNGRFVATGRFGIYSSSTKGYTAYSIDGISWTIVDLDVKELSGLMFSDGKFFAKFSLAGFRISADGVSWVKAFNTELTKESGIYVDGKYFAIGEEGSGVFEFEPLFIADNFPTHIEEISGLNIAYGSTPPDDTSKLWIPLATKPSNVEISADSLETAVDSIATKTAVLPAATSGSSSVEIDGKIYIFGGSVSATRTQILVYDPSTDTITTFKRTVVADDGSTTEEDVVMPANSFYAAAVAINGKAYIFGGSSYATNIYEFDPITGTVTKKSALADGVQYASAVAINEKAYIFGGSITSTGNTDMIQEYDPVTDTCVDTGINLATKTYGTAAVAINEKAYIFGGYNYLDTIQEYDPSTNTIKTKEAVLLDGMFYASAVVINGKAYILGGQTGSSIREDMIQEYDPITDTITEKTGILAVGLAQATASVANGKAYIFGGTSGSNTDTIQEYTVKSYLAENNVKLMATAVASGGEKIVTSIVNSKTGQVKMHILSAFVGDADGYAAAQTAYVYNETAGAWQDLAGNAFTPAE